MPAAVAIPAIISAAGSIGGALIGSSASKSAANTQSQAAQQIAAMLGGATQSGINQISFGTGQGQAGIDTGLNDAQYRLQDIFSGQNANLTPYLQAGTQGVNSLMQATGQGGDLTKQFAAPTAEEAAATPGYQFTLSEGLKAIQRAAAAQGGTNGGGTLKSLMQYGTGLASQNYQQAYTNALNTYNTNRNSSMQNLSALLGVGQYGTSQYNQAAENYGNTSAQDSMAAALQKAQLGQQGNLAIAQMGLQGKEAIAQALTGGANAQAAGTVGAANSWNQGLGGVANAAQGYSLMNLLSQRQTPVVTGAIPPGAGVGSIASFLPPRSPGL